jgi:hypothetical protein
MYIFVYNISQAWPSLVAQLSFQPSRTYAQYDLAALVSVPDIDETMTDAHGSVDKSIYPSVV